MTYLASSKFTDATSDTIQRAVANITKDSHGDSDTVKAIFYWVRDHAKYTIGLYPHRASETLLNAFGSCTNKSNLFVALCRAAGVPAGFNLMRVDARFYFGPVVNDRIRKFFAPSSLHTFCSVFLNEKWIRVDPSDDVRLSLCGTHNWPQVRRVDFDGVNHAELNLQPDHIIDLGRDILPDVDHVLEKVPTKSAVIVAALNDYVDFMRRRLILYETCDRVFDDFMEWYAVAHVGRHAAFIEAETDFASSLGVPPK